MRPLLVKSLPQNVNRLQAQIHNRRQWFNLTFRDPNERWVGVNKALSSPSTQTSTSLFNAAM